MAGEEIKKDEEKLKWRYLKLSKILFLIVVIYSLWITMLFIGVYFLDLGLNWAFFPADQWLLSGIVLVSAVIGLDILFLLHFTFTKRKHRQPEPPQQPVYIQGKQVHNYTIPFDAKGGIFSKTYIMIDTTRVLNLRYQMIHPNELWPKKQ